MSQYAKLFPAGRFTLETLHTDMMKYVAVGKAHEARNWEQTPEVWQPLGA